MKRRALVINLKAIKGDCLNKSPLLKGVNNYIFCKATLVNSRECYQLLFETMESVRNPLKEKLITPIRLSPMTMNIHVLVDKLADESLDFRQLAGILSHYPVIAARLLALANSAWAAPPIPVTTLETACARLGISVVKSMTIALAVAASFNQANCPAFDNQYFWSNSLLVAEGAALLARHCSNDIDTIKTAGILHGIGLLWMVEHLPIETGRALQQVRQESAVPLTEALQHSAGGDYCQVGGWIARQWRIPEVLVGALEQHQNHSYRGEAWEIALLVGAALKMATALPLDAKQKCPENEALSALGINQDQQQTVFEQLAGRYEATKLLAREMFA